MCHQLIDHVIDQLISDVFLQQTQLTQINVTMTTKTHHKM